MAQQGLNGSLDVFNDEQGLWRMTNSDQFVSDGLADELGSHWYADYGGFKRCPACRWLARTPECMEGIMQQTGWSAAGLHTIEIQSSPRLVNDMMDYWP